MAAAALSVIWVLAACSGSSTSTSGSPTASAKPLGSITVLAASSLTGAFTTLGTTFEAQHPGSKVTFSFAASSELASQITGGAPADVFASASAATMTQVASDVTGTPTTFVRNSLEIAVPASNPGKVKGLADFANPALKIALCAPEVPCGAAAVKVFAAAKLTPKADTLEPDAKATLAKVTLGEVDAALVYHTDVLAVGPKVIGIPFPEASSAINDYPIAVLANARNPTGARAFLDLVTSADGAKVLSAAGFTLP